MQHFRLWVFIILLFISNNALGQFSSIFGNTTTSWEILIGACDSWCSYTASTAGDTTISANTYKIVDNSYLGQIFLREDTTQGKVWYYDETDNNEYLLMDLNLVVGDTFGIFNNSNAQMEYFPVDSVYYFNNKKHIRLVNFTDGCFYSDIQVTFIEGVGTNTGLSYESQLYKITGIICYTRNTTTSHLYDNPYYPTYFPVDSCEYCVTSTKELSTKTKYTIFPNPFIHEINISSDEYLIEYELYDVLGKLIRTEKTNEYLYSIDTRDLEAGVYILVLKHKNYRITSQKIIKYE